MKRTRSERGDADPAVILIASGLILCFLGGGSILLDGFSWEALLLAMVGVSLLVFLFWTRRPRKVYSDQLPREGASHRSS